MYGNHFKSWRIKLLLIAILLILLLVGFLSNEATIESQGFSIPAKGAGTVHTELARNVVPFVVAVTYHHLFGAGGGGEAGTAYCATFFGRSIVLGEDSKGRYVP